MKKDLSEEIIKAKIDQELNDAQTVQQWCKRIQAKVLSSPSGLSFSFLIPNIFDYKKKHNMIWNKEIVKWFNDQNLAVEIRTENDGIHEFAHKKLVVSSSQIK